MAHLPECSHGAILSAFDRLLVAQALVEKLPIVGRGQSFDSYGVQRIW
jgi:PIN domain nuclease of toxin-antitoxin system